MNTENKINRLLTEKFTVGEQIKTKFGVLPIAGFTEFKKVGEEEYMLLPYLEYEGKKYVFSDETDEQGIHGIFEIQDNLENVVKQQETEVENVMKPKTDEFSYSDSQDFGKGRHRQNIIYKGKEIGYLLTIEKNWLSPLEEIYILPDIDYGMDIIKKTDKGVEYINTKEPWNEEIKPTKGTGLIDGKLGWIDFKRFTNYEDALQYAKQNFDKLIFFLEYGDYD